MSHRNAPLTPTGRLLLCQRIQAGEPIAHVAAAMSISRRCASKWWHRYLELGVEGLHDRSSRPRRSPTRVPERVEAKICRQRRAEKVGPDRLAIHLDLPASTIYRVLRRHDLNRLDHLVALDRGRVVAHGPPADVLRHPQVVESYLGTQDEHELV